MNRRHTASTMLLLLATLMLSTLWPQADAFKPLPDFAVKALDGRTVRSGQLSSRERWLLIYVEPGCRACDSLLRIFRREPGVADLAQKVVVVVDAPTADDARQMSERATWIPGESWYVDTERQAAPALKARGVPIVYGVRGGTIEWSLNGALPNAKRLESILLTWCEDE